jgi:opacity protein-like surface antigen
MTQNIRIYITWLVSFFTLINALGQTEMGLNVGYIEPLLLSRTDDPHYSGSADYSSSAFMALKYKEKATNTMFLGIDLSLDNHRLHFKESLGSHFGSNNRDMNYKFNYLYFKFYPEWVFGDKVKFYFNTGITFGILLNSNMSGTIGSSKRIDLPDGHWYYEYSEEFVEGNARDDLRDFNVGVGIGTGLQYIISDNWSIQVDISNRFLPYPVDSGFAKSQLDLLISAGATYTINRNKKPLLFRSGFQE